MKYKLINKPNPKYNAKEQILINRGIKESELQHYMNLTDDDIHDPECFGYELMYKAAKCFINHLKEEDHICVVVDADCDGYTSSALIINYIYDLTNTDYISNKVKWFLHEGKQHGLQDCMDWIKNIKPNLVIVPDAGKICA